jgi:uncharacterized membrane protein
MFGTMHVAFAVAGLTLGAAVALRQKGTRSHRRLGYSYALSLLAVNLSALSVYEDSAGFGPFHVLALVSLATLVSGFVPAVLRRPASWWLELHAYFLSWSYVGLVSAGAAQLATMAFRLPASLTVVLPTMAITICGGLLIHTRLPQTLSALASPGRRAASRLRPERSTCG